jgi:hypothetical protein
LSYVNGQNCFLRLTLYNKVENMQMPSINYKLAHEVDGSSIILMVCKTHLKYI